MATRVFHVRPPASRFALLCSLQTSLLCDSGLSSVFSARDIWTDRPNVLSDIPLGDRCILRVSCGLPALLARPDSHAFVTARTAAAVRIVYLVFCRTNSTISRLLFALNTWSLLTVKCISIRNFTKDMELFPLYFKRPLQPTMFPSNPSLLSTVSLFCIVVVLVAQILFAFAIKHEAAAIRLSLQEVIPPR
jgi:hypothetical protein